MHFSALFCLCFLLACEVSYAASGVQGGKANGMGTAFVAVADDASAIAYNPAGITQLSGAQVYGGIMGVVPTTNYTSPSGIRQHMEKQIFAAPNLYFTSDTPVNKLYYGIGLYSPFGLGGTKWSTTGLTRYISTESLTSTFAINPTVAYQVNESLSIAAGFNYMYAQLKSATNTNQTFLGAADGVMSMKGDGGGFGYNAGILFKASEHINIGVAYRSEIKVKFKGDLQLSGIAPAIQTLFGGPTYSSSFSTETVFPSVLNIGLAYTSDGGSQFSIEVQRNGWSSIDRNVLLLSQPVPAAGLGNTITPLQWKDVWQIKAGMNYKLSEASEFRLGYSYNGASEPESTVSPSAPLSEAHLIGIGYGYKAGNYFVDLSYFGGILVKRTVNNAILSGSYKGQIHHVGLSLGYNIQ
ncbi:hypothetical protein D8Y20_05005 [Mariprofundus sp. EBB-1]|uniref:OmpP1/FadL family transporter n=1 Tax=Mariprofundus sp. EBB-1 TaxID=2650971 RepID=UPI000EF22B1A|nr:outer membrane protein transport protein [Mariprofundus sp. EBB-1]RLL53532.1 hypothetical protein D8Y20_05005 [Mariprofundus sp. EBB-1]